MIRGKSKLMVAIDTDNYEKAVELIDKGLTHKEIAQTMGKSLP